MHKITKRNEEYFVKYENQKNEEKAKIWYEKKTDEYYIRLKTPNPSNREFIRINVFEKKQINDIYEFETKEDKGWKSRMTDEEKEKYEECERIMKEIEKVATERKPKPLTEEEKLQKQVDELREKLLKKQEELMRKRGN